ncbi:hypothetical protein Moror_17307 [Moniliophthora roreri MCA 2997]|uniref:F-box domain-containing protein n=2 Tax=Moniliophthora roreri TaxID=221103 RepID=V2XFA0_MONRO|nr:hypothetical protein Moror_17307 [Moniliophthora roreri MCA 2997]
MSSKGQTRGHLIVYPRFLRPSSVSIVKSFALIRVTESMDKHQRSILLSEEAQLIEQLAIIRTKLNTLAPIAVLPPEILLHILSLCAQRTHPIMRQYCRHVMAFTQVCRQWRSLALQTSKLWTTIDLCNTAYASTFLTRSKDAQIALVAISPLKSYGESIERHRNRISSIDAILFPDSMLALFRSIDADDVITLNNLTELNLRTPFIIGHVDLSCLQIPAVRRLSLEGVKVDWESCNGLISLRLCGLPITHAPTYHQLLGMLERSPFLEEVELEDAVPVDIESYKSRPPISLPYLSKMTIGSKKADVVRVFQGGIIVPSSTQVKIRCPAVTNWAVPSDVNLSGYIDPGFSPDVLYSIAQYYNTRTILAGVATMM